MNPFEFVLAIILITTVGGIIRAKHLGRGGGREGRSRFMRGRWDGIEDDDLMDENAETRRLREEVRSLKDRIQTLERIAVDKESSLSREIDDLRDR